MYTISGLRLIPDPWKWSRMIGGLILFLAVVSLYMLFWSKVCMTAYYEDDDDDVCCIFFAGHTNVDSKSQAVDPASDAASKPFSLLRIRL